MKLEAFGTIESGVLKIIHANRFKDLIKTLKDGRYKITIEKNYKKRSNPQNAYLFGVVYPIVLDALKSQGFNDMDIEKVHDLLKLKFLKIEVVSSDGVVLQILGSTAKLTTSEFMDYLANIKESSQEYLGVYVPSPNEQIEFNFE